MSSMDLSHLDFAKLLPVWMRQDAADAGLAKALNEIIPVAANAVKKLSTWDVLDSLNDTELDELAWESNITWYDFYADIAGKRQTIKDADRIFRTKGTSWAVQRVINTYFGGESNLLPWWEYAGGRFPHFKVVTTNATLKYENYKMFLAVLEEVKRQCAVLDAILILIQSQGMVYAGSCVRTGSVTMIHAYQPGDIHIRANAYAAFPPVRSGQCTVISHSAEQGKEL
ncbi:MAG: phage tail protein I [Oscillospiraceae bacterium]|jgi:phage tail P2-like protein|nr:phage tail protein I [Oscillospiraceae bacterium]